MSQQLGQDFPLNEALVLGELLFVKFLLNRSCILELKALVVFTIGKLEIMSLLLYAIKVV